MIPADPMIAADRRGNLRYVLAEGVAASSANECLKISLLKNVLQVFVAIMGLQTQKLNNSG